MAGEWRFPSAATPPGSALYYSIRLAPAALRDELAALVGWRHEVRCILTSVSDPGVARLKLDWWRGELGRAFRALTDPPAGIAAEPPGHPLSLALQPVLGRHQLPVEPFLAIAERVEAELRCQVPPDRRAWQEAEEHDLGALFELLIRCHGIAGMPELARARRLGGYCGQVYRLRDAGRLLRAGRAVLSAEQLGTVQPTAAGRRELPRLLAAAGSQLRADRAATDDAGLPLCLRIHVRLMDALLAELAAAGFEVLDQRIGLTPIRKLWLAWRESRRRGAAPDPRGS